MTTSAESERIEDAIQELAERDALAIPPHVWRRRLEELDAKIAKLAVPFDEWETVYRQRLQVERDLLVAEVERGAAGASSDERPPSMLENLAAIGTVALIATDAMLLLANLVGPRHGRR